LASATPCSETTGFLTSWISSFGLEIKLSGAKGITSVSFGLAGSFSEELSSSDGFVFSGLSGEATEPVTVEGTGVTSGIKGTVVSAFGSATLVASGKELLTVGVGVSVFVFCTGIKGSANLAGCDFLGWDTDRVTGTE
jgi:hypothetical protein